MPELNQVFRGMTEEGLSSCEIDGAVWQPLTVENHSYGWSWGVDCARFLLAMLQQKELPWFIDAQLQCFGFELHYSLLDGNGVLHLCGAEIGIGNLPEQVSCLNERVWIGEYRTISLGSMSIRIEPYEDRNSCYNQYKAWFVRGEEAIKHRQMVYPESYQRNSAMFLIDGLPEDELAHMLCRFERGGFSLRFEELFRVDEDYPTELFWDRSVKYRVVAIGNNARLGQKLVVYQPLTEAYADYRLVERTDTRKGIRIAYFVLLQEGSR